MKRRSRFSRHQLSLESVSLRSAVATLLLAIPAYLATQWLSSHVLAAILMFVAAFIAFIVIMAIGLLIVAVVRVRQLLRRLAKGSLSQRQDTDTATALALSLLLATLLIIAYSSKGNPRISRQLERRLIDKRYCDREAFLSLIEKLLRACSRMIPLSYREDTLATMRDALYESIYQTTSSREIAQVAGRMVLGVVKTAIAARKRQLAANVTGSACAITLVSGGEGMVDIHLPWFLSVPELALCIIVGGLIGGWFADIAERRVP
jgi:hypothetical protein